MKPIKRVTLISAVLIALTSANMPTFAEEHSTQASTTAPASVKVTQTEAALRDLWMGHAFWVRNVVLQTTAGNKAATSAAEDEVVANAKKIATSVEPFYGQAGADKLFTLLAGHYGALKKYLEATAAGSKAKQETALKTVASNVEEISAFLSGANPNLPRDAVRGLLMAHVGHHMQQMQQMHDKQYQQEAQTWEAMKGHMYVIADTLAGAIAKQFPEKFI